MEEQHILWRYSVPNKGKLMIIDLNSESWAMHLLLKFHKGKCIVSNVNKQLVESVGVLERKLRLSMIDAAEPSLTTK